MELVYLRIFDTHNNQNLSFIGKDINFHGEYRFFYNNTSKSIELEFINSYYKNLYGKEVAITGIVGANGVGKTTILKFIQYLIAKLNNFESGHSYIYDTWNWVAIVNSANGLQLAKPLTEESYLGSSRNLIDFSNISFENVRLEYTGTKSCSIFYSPHFDLSEPSFDKPDYIDVSSDFLIYKEVRKKEEDDQNVSQIVHFRRNDIKRQIDFIQFADSLENEQIKFYEQIKRDQISVRFHEFSKNFDNDPRYIDIADCEIYKLLDKNFIGRNSTIIYEFRRKKRDETSELSLLRFYRRLVEIIFDCIEYRPEPKQDKGGNYRPSITKGLKVDSNNITESFELFFKHLVIFDSKILNQFIELINRAKDIFLNYFSYDASNEAFQCSLKTAQELIIIEKEIFSLLPYKSNLELFNFEWDGMSTGEKAYLNLFSRLHHGVNTLKTHTNISNSELVYFLIDEPATGFHPQWQKEYLFKLLEFFKARLDKRFHIIISSHSSFLISDLQKEDVLALSGNKNLYQIENTFGANIHELLADSFFLQDGFIGDFAKNKIEDLLNYLVYNENKAIDPSNIKPKENWNDGSAQKIINIIGEPLIKNRLQELYDEKFKSITELELQIKQIESLIRKKKQ